MRRIPWLALILLVGLLVITLPLASAELAQQQLGVAGAYLPLVHQAVLPTPVSTLTPARGDAAVIEMIVALLDQRREQHLGE